MDPREALEKIGCMLAEDVINAALAAPSGEGETVFDEIALPESA